MNAYLVNATHNIAPVGAAQELAVDGVVVTADDLNEKARYAELSVKSNDVRYTLDGTDPVSAGAGAILPQGIHTWSRQKLASARFIESVGGSDGVIRIQGMLED